MALVLAPPPQYNHPYTAGDRVREETMAVRCAYVDENGVQCPATTGTPYADGWGLFAMPDSIEAKKGWYCRDHSRALGRDLHDDDKAA
jgi:hypothetical protein